MTLDENTLVALMVAGALALVSILRKGRAYEHAYWTCSALLYGTLTVAAWYTDWPLAFQYWSMLVLMVGLTGLSVWRAHRSRPRPGWWGGAHERIEQT